MSALKWLEQWYAEQCDGVWEELYGITIQTLDNPGWKVTIQLIGTKYEAQCQDETLLIAGEPPSHSNGNMTGPSWAECHIGNREFNGAGDPRRLEEIIDVFRRWAKG